MKRNIYIKLIATTAFFLNVISVSSQNKGAVLLPKTKFITGDNPEWSKPAFDDSQWKEIQTGNVWQAQGYPDYHGYAWYRIHVHIQ